jgi:hypothetical protein
MTTVDLQLTQTEKERIVRGQCHVYKDAPHGRAGDLFDVGGKQFELIDICERSMDRIARQYGLLREYGSLSGFIEEWEASHPGPCDPEMALFIHWFRQV